MKKFSRASKITDPHQLALFDDLGVDDPLSTYYRRLRKIGATLSLNPAEDRIYVHGPNGVPAWAVKTIALLRDRIRADLLRVEHGIEPADEPEALDGGAVLHRLPTRRSPELEPPVRRRTPASNRRGPQGAA